ncbi:MAG: hypothetical protein AcusKO_48360 [Acuticoccus sp.]
MLDDPSILFARRAVACLVGVALLALSVAMGLALATWTVSDPSLTHATAAPVENMMGAIGAAFADPVMQLFGLGAPLLVAPLPLWGWRLLMGRPLGLATGRLVPGLVALFTAPGFFNVFPVTETWPLPMGLGGVVGVFWGGVLPNWFAVTSGAANGFFGGILGVVALVALIRAVAAPRTQAPSAAMGFQIRRQMATRDEYGLDDTDAFESESSVLSTYRGAFAHAVLTLRAQLRRGPAKPRAGEPHLRDALARASAEELDGPAVYRARSAAAHAAPQPVAYDDFDDETLAELEELAPPQARPHHAAPAPRRTPRPAPAPLDEDDFAADPAPRAAAPRRAAVRPAPAMDDIARSSLAFTAPSRGPAARVRVPAPEEAAPPPPTTDEMPLPDEALPDDDTYAEEDDPGTQVEFFDEYAQASAEAEAEAGTSLYDDEPYAEEAADAPYDDAGDEMDEDPLAAEIARHSARTSAPAGPAPQLPVAARVTPPAGAMKPGRRVLREAQPSLLPGGEYEFPPLALLAAPPVDAIDSELTEDALEANARVLEGVLEDFGVRGSIIHVRPGPVVTLYELEPAPGIKSSRVIGLADDIARSMSAISARVAVIPGKNAIGIELPNRKRITVFLRELLASRDFERTKAKLPLCLGKTIGGEAVIADLARMPHLLVAGTTGSGKSVSVNAMILSLLYFHNPESCRVILIDPKMLELSVYDGIPHLLTEVVTDPKKAVSALKWAVREMEDRYRKMAKLGVRNIDGYNQRLKESGGQAEPLTRIVQTGFDKRTGEAIFEEEVLELEPIPYIVVIVDEMADLMLVAGKEIEGAIQRLAQMARAAGIHLIMATQRPSVDVITGTIKANFPTRVSFQVTSKIDSRTILGEMGAEQLLGMGDMLYMAGGGRIQRVHGPFVSDEEVEDVVAHLKLQGVPEYLNEVLDEDDDEDVSATTSGLEGLSESDDLYDRAVALVLRDRKASTSYVQRRLSIGYNRAATLIERMEKEGVVSPANHAGKREILVPGEQETA